MYLCRYSVLPQRKRGRINVEFVAVDIVQQQEMNSLCNYWGYILLSISRGRGYCLLHTGYLMRAFVAIFCFPGKMRLYHNQASVSVSLSLSVSLSVSISLFLSVCLSLSL